VLYSGKLQSKAFMEELSRSRGHITKRSCYAGVDVSCMEITGFSLTWKVREKSGNFVDGQEKMMCIVRVA